MKFFIDSADIAEIRKAAAWGLVDGVTTNPSLVAKTGRKFMDVIDDILAAVDGPVSVEVTALDAAGMIEQGTAFAARHKNVVVKIPLTLDGLAACRELSSRGIGVNVTLCFSAVQALLAAKAGARYISPFVGRLDDISQVGMDLIADIVQIYENYGYRTEVLVASVRSPTHVLEAAKLGAHVATIPFSVIAQLAKHPLTDLGLERFMKDWEKVPG